MQAELKARIANCPKRLHVVDELPRNAMGKVQKNVLRETQGALTRNAVMAPARPAGAFPRSLIRPAALIPPAAFQ